MPDFSYLEAEVHVDVACESAVTARGGLGWMNFSECVALLLLSYYKRLRMTIGSDRAIYRELCVEGGRVNHS